MKRNIANLQPLNSSFLSCEKDTETILKTLFIENQPHSNILKKLLVISNKDCLDNLEYDSIVETFSLRKLVEEQYIILQPKIRFPEHEDIKSYIRINFEDFMPNKTNPEFRDCLIVFDIICHTDQWDIGDYRSRPLKIAGYIDGLLNNKKLSGIGTLHFLGTSQLVVNSILSGYTLIYKAVHGSDDIIPAEDELND